MKITNIRPGIVDLYKIQNHRARDARNEPGTPEPDRAEISSRAREMQRYLEVLKTMPGERRERVENLKKLVNEGKYEPAAEKIAQKILEERRLDARR